MDHPLGPIESIILVALVAWALLPGTALVAIARVVREFRASRRDDVARSAPFTGRAGPATVRGRVRVIEGALVPIETVILQRAVRGPGGVLRAWKEARRTRIRAPFDVELTNGARVRVEPDAETTIDAPMSRPGPTSESTRERRAAIHDGDVVTVSGALRASRAARAPVATAYRGSMSAPRSSHAPRRLALRASPMHPLSVSTSARVRDRRATLAVHAIAAILATGGAIGANAFLLAPYYALVFHGHAERAIVLDDDPGPLEVSFADGDSMLDERVSADRATVDEVEAREAFGAVAVVDVRIARGTSPVVVLGKDSRAPAELGELAFATVVLVGVYAWLARRTTPWYERPMFHEPVSVVFERPLASR